MKWILTYYSTTRLSRRLGGGMCVCGVGEESGRFIVCGTEQIVLESPKMDAVYKVHGHLPQTSSRTGLIFAAAFARIMKLLVSHILQRAIDRHTCQCDRWFTVSIEHVIKSVIYDQLNCEGKTLNTKWKYFCNQCSSISERVLLFGRLLSFACLSFC
jgi:hypothetical protein